MKNVALIVVSHGWHGIDTDYLLLRMIFIVNR